MRNMSTRITRNLTRIMSDERGMTTVEYAMGTAAVVGLGGVLEPPGARPNIVEDGVFLGSRCILVEGVLVEEEAVLVWSIIRNSLSSFIG